MAKKTAPPAAEAEGLRESDLEEILREGARSLAPADVDNLLSREGELRAHAEELPARLKLLRRQIDLAFTLLRDHRAEGCPQIPYDTVAIVASALLYFAEPVDIIPDFLPTVGHLDDAAVMAMAFRLARKGIRRYCAFKGISARSVIR